MTETPRHSNPSSADLVSTDEERAEREAYNAIRQAERVQDIVQSWLEVERQPFRLRPSVILDLHRTALDGLSHYAGNYRPAGVLIEGSRHEPGGAHLVPKLVEELCDYINENWEQPAVHLAAYAMWRLNWIHPFADGNGRTARALSYVILCLRLGYLLPGERTIPDHIVDNRNPYYEALDTADAAWREGRLDLFAMENLLTDLLACQLLSVVEKATGAKAR